MFINKVRIDYGSRTLDIDCTLYNVNMILNYILISPGGVDVRPLCRG